MDEKGGAGPPGMELNGTSAGRPAPSASEAAAREPFTRAPWPAVVLAGSILAVYAVQAASGHDDAWNERFGLHPRDLLDGKLPVGLVTALWSHAGWAHAGLNAAFALAFGAPVARRLGGDLRGVVLFAAFYLVGGVIASLGFTAVHLHGDAVLVGASGAVSALMGGATRLIGLRPVASAGGGAELPPPPLAPFTSSVVVSMSFAFLVSNLILGFAGIDLGQGDAPLAWEAHLAGFAAGLLLIAPFARLASPKASG